MQVKIKCPACNTESTFFLAKKSYQGPYRCWKCRELATIKIDSGGLKSCERLSQAEFDRQQEMKAAKAAARRKKSKEA